jgi:hypothetical protein
VVWPICTATAATPPKTRPTPVSETPSASEHAQQDLGRRHDDQRHRQRGGAADRRRTDQLAAPALLLAARVAPDEEHAHQRGERGPEAAELPGNVAADGREVVRRPDHRDQPRVPGHRRDVVRPRRPGREHALALRGRVGDEDREEQQVDRDPDPLATQRKPQQHPASGQGAHAISSP